MFLTEKGYRILDTNWRCREGEIDLVCRDRGRIVFVEVRTRREGSMVPASSTLTPAKQRRLVAAAGRYLSSHKLWDVPCRFDLVALTMRKDDPDIEHFEHIIDAHALGGGHSAWQPW